MFFCRRIRNLSEADDSAGLLNSNDWSCFVLACCEVSHTLLHPNGLKLGQFMQVATVTSVADRCHVGMRLLFASAGCSRAVASFGRT